MLGPWARSPACVEVHSPPGTKQTTPQGCIFTACQSDCVYSNGLNWISGCEGNLLIVFLMMPWAAPGGLTSRHSSRISTGGNYRSTPRAPQLPAGHPCPRDQPRASPKCEQLEIPSPQSKPLHCTDIALWCNLSGQIYVEILLRILYVKFLSVFI